MSIDTLEAPVNEPAPREPVHADAPPGDEVYVFPATVGQLGFWYLDQLQPGNPAYNVAYRFRFEGPLRVEVLERAIGELARRHEALRTTFALDGGDPVQVVGPPGPISLPIDDLRPLPPADRVDRARVLAQDEANLGFDLAHGPLFRARLARLADDEHVLFLTAHHIVCDGWSTGLLVRELGPLYEAFASDRPAPLPELPLQYGDYAVWQHDRLAAGELDAQIGYWQSKLAGASPAEVPADRPRPAEGAARGAIASTLLPKSLSDPLVALSHREGATFYMTSLACLKVLLQAYGPHDDLTVGSPVAGRSTPELESVVGLFINPVALRTDLSGDPTFLELLGRVRETVTDAFANQDVPFARVVRAVRPRLEADKFPLFRINFIFQRAFLKPFQGAGVKMTPIPSVSPGAMYDLTFFMVERAEGWRLSIEYNTDLYEEATVHRLLREFETVFAAVAEESGRAISTIRPRGDAVAEGVEDAAPSEPEVKEDGDAVYVFPATVGQLGFWYLDRLRPGNPSHAVNILVRLRGPLQVDRLQQALGELARRHESLRTTFSTDGDDPVQVVNPPCPVPLPVDDVRGLPPAARAARAEAVEQEEGNRGFDLTRGPLFRARLVRLTDDEGLLFLTVHHIVCDGWSTGLIVSELGTIYGSLGGSGLLPPAPPLQYGDYAVWQRDRLAAGELAAQLDYWRSKLAGASPTTVPADRPGAPGAARGAIASALFSGPLTDALGRLRAEQQVTPFMIGLAGLNLLLLRHTNRDDICVGTVHAGRSRVELESVVGLFINPVALRTDLSGEPTFLDVLTRVRDTVLEAFANQDLPFARIVDAVNPKRDAGRHPIFDINFLYQRDFVRPVQAGDLTLAPVPYPPRGSMFDLNFFLLERADGLHAFCEYNALQRDAASIERLLGEYQAILTAACAGPTRRVSELVSVDLAWPAPVAATECQAFPRSATIHELFEEQADAAPEAIAVEFRDERLTYRELNARANRLAHQLRRLGVARGSPVGLYMDRSAEVVVGLLAILKAGGAYVPLDPQYPADRLAFMIRDTAAKVILLHGPTAARPRPEGGGEVRWVDVGAAAVAAEPADNPAAGAIADDLAYVMYTSGSTGRPKGVLVGHRAVVRLVRGTDYCRFAPDEVFLHHSPLSFDASTFEIWGPLLNGGRLVVMPPGPAAPESLGAAVRQHGVTTLWLTSGLFNLIVEQRAEDLAPLRQLLAGGDVLSPAHVRKALAALRNGVLINGYGPTEGTTFSCCFRMTRDYQPGETIPIGRPIANTTAHVLDEQRRPVPPGAAGELYVGGDGVAAGYLNRPDLTAERFVPDPFSPEPEARLYRTGDRVRWRPDGELEFLGRLDGQIKLRGFRIEPGELETALARHAQVREAVVVAREDVPGDRRLVAYVTPRRGSVDTAALRAALKDELPEYMVPAAVVVLPGLPLTPNGKVDRAALPPPPRSDSGGRATPRDQTEARLFPIWEQTLGQPVTAADADFFDEGGNSFLAMRFVAAVEREFGRSLSLGAFFESPTIAATAAALRAEKWNADDDQVFALRRGGSRPPLVLVDAGPLYRPLVRAFGPNQPVYGVALPKLKDLPEDFTVRDIAARLIDALAAANLPGPYILAGWSMAGVIAYEMAQQLRARGEEVPLLILFDTSTPNYLRSFRGWRNFPKRFFLLGAKLFYQLNKMRRMSFGQAWRYVRDRAQSTEARYRQTVARLEALPAHAPADLPLPLTWEFQYRAGLHYTPEPYDGPMLLVRSEFLTTQLFRDPKLGWGEVARGGFWAHEMPGEHDSMFFDPVVGQLAAILAGYLDRPGRVADVDEPATAALVP